MTKENLIKTKEYYPNAEVLIHPECTEDVLEMADYIGSTAGIIDYATKSDTDEFIIVTELGVLYELKNKNPNKKFYNLGCGQCCPDMKKITLEKVLNALKNNETKVELDKELRTKAYAPLEKMLKLGK